MLTHMRYIGGVSRPHINCSVGDYLAKSRMKFTGVWGADFEILSAASLFSTDIYCMSIHNLVVSTSGRNFPELC